LGRGGASRARVRFDDHPTNPQTTHRKQEDTTAYIASQREATNDQNSLKRYYERADDTLASHNIEDLVDYGRYEVLEGPAIESVVILKFPDAAAAKRWYHGEEYHDVVKDRFAGATYRAVLFGAAEAGT
jgi:uncharacterized protein (DUF1330 family)